MADLHSIEGGKKNSLGERTLEACECGCPWFKAESYVDSPSVRVETCMMCQAEYTVLVEPCDG